jgi:integrase
MRSPRFDRTSPIRAITAEDPAIGTFLHLAAATGARRGELVALRWSDVDLDQGELVISRSVVDAGDRRLVIKDTKTHQGRRIALAAGAVRALRDHRRHQLEQRLALGLGRTDAPWIFCHPDSSLPWRPDYVSKRWRRLRTELKLEDARLHDLRHFSVTQLLAAGVDPKTVAGRHGHARVAMTLDRYSHFVPARDRDAAEVLDGLLG